jgi:hypothetical protein
MGGENRFVCGYAVECMVLISTPERKPRAIYLRGMMAWTRSQAHWLTWLVEEDSHKVGAQACEVWLASMAMVNQDQAFTPGMLKRVELSVKRVTSRYRNVTRRDI